MPYGRRRMTSPVKSDKHEVTWSNLSQNASTVQTVALAVGTQSASKDDSTEVETGAHVYGIYFEFHFSAAETGNANVIHWKIEYNPSDKTMSNPNVYYQTDRAYTMKRGMEMLPVNVSTVFKRIFVVKIPRKYSRLVESDTIRFRYIASSTQQINACGIAIYKEFY